MVPGGGVLPDVPCCAWGWGFARRSTSAPPDDALLVPRRAGLGRWEAAPRTMFFMMYYCGRTRTRVRLTVSMCSISPLPPSATPPLPVSLSHTHPGMCVPPSPTLSMTREHAIQLCTYPSHRRPLEDSRSLIFSCNLQGHKRSPTGVG